MSPGSITILLLLFRTAIAELLLNFTITGKCHKSITRQLQNKKGRPVLISRKLVLERKITGPVQNSVTDVSLCGHEEQGKGLCDPNW
jgi:hypothetical protein